MIAVVSKTFSVAQEKERANTNQFVNFFRLVLAFCVFPLCFMGIGTSYLVNNPEMIFHPVALVCVANHFGVWGLSVVALIQLILTFVGLKALIWTALAGFAVRAFKDISFIFVLAVNLSCAFGKGSYPSWFYEQKPVPDVDGAMLDKIQNWLDANIVSAFDSDLEEAGVDFERDEEDHLELGMFGDRLFPSGHRRSLAFSVVQSCQEAYGFVTSVLSYFAMLIRMSVAIIAFLTCLFTLGGRYYGTNSEMILLPVTIMITGQYFGLWTLCAIMAVQVILTLAMRPYLICETIAGFVVKVFDDNLYISTFSFNLSCSLWRGQWPDLDFKLPEGLFSDEFDCQLEEELEVGPTVSSEPKRIVSATTDHDDLFACGDVEMERTHCTFFLTERGNRVDEPFEYEKPSTSVGEAGEKMAVTSGATEVPVDAPGRRFEKLYISAAMLFCTTLQFASPKVEFMCNLTRSKAYTSFAFLCNKMRHLASSALAYGFKPLLIKVGLWALGVALSSFGIYIGLVLAVYQTEGYYVTSMTFTEFVWLQISSSLGVNLSAGLAMVI